MGHGDTASMADHNRSRFCERNPSWLRSLASHSLATWECPGRGRLRTLKRTLLAYRISLGLFIAALVLSGLTAFPLLHELSLLCRWLGINDSAAYETLSGFRGWIAFVFFGLEKTYAAFPFVGYGTDWLAFGLLIIALFFIGPFREPVRNAWVLRCGLISCGGAVIPLALLCGHVRQIPIVRRLLNCSFGILGAIPLLYCLHLTKRLCRET